MSKNTETLTTIETLETTALVTATGGRTDAGLRWGKLRVGYEHQSDYESCLQNNREQAEAAYPNTTSWLSRRFGDTDKNGRARADYEREGMKNCPLPK